MTAVEELEIRVKAIEQFLQMPQHAPAHRMYVGINADAATVRVSEVLEVGARFCRFPVWADLFTDRVQSFRAYERFAAELFTAHVEPLIVCDGRSWANDDYPVWARLPVHYVQMGNEWDILGMSSFTQSAKQFSADLAWARAWFDYHRPDATPKRYLIAGGAASGHEWLLNDVDLTPVDAIAVHPYGQRADGYPTAGWGHGELRDLIRRYKIHHKPVWVTEFGVQDNEMDQAEQAEYIRRCLTIMEEEGVIGAFWYCLSPLMHPLYGLDQGPALEAFREEALRRA